MVMTRSPLHAAVVTALVAAEACSAKARQSDLHTSRPLEAVVDQENLQIHTGNDMSPPLGQSFTAGMDGQLVGVRLALEARKNPRDLLVYLSGADALGRARGPVLTSGVVTTNPTAPRSRKWYDVVFTEPYEQSAGEILAIMLVPLPPTSDHGWHDFAMSRDNAYEGGRLYYRGHVAGIGGFESGRLDLAFQTIVSPSGYWNRATWPPSPGRAVRTADRTPREIAGPPAAGKGVGGTDASDPRWDRMKGALLMEEWDLPRMRNVDLALWYNDSRGKPVLFYGTVLADGGGRLYLRWNTFNDTLELYHVREASDSAARCPYPLRGMIKKAARIEADGKTRVIAIGGSGDGGKIFCRATPKE